MLIIIILHLTVACRPGDAIESGASVPVDPAAYPGGDLLVSASWLRDHLDEPDLRIIDLRSLVDYNRGHIPRASHAWWQDTIEINNDTYGMLVGEPGAVQLISNAGIDEHSRVVLYDADGNRHAARVLWMLHALGFERVALLNGGAQAWQEAGFDLERDQPSPSPGGLTYHLDYDVLIGADTLLQDLDDESVVIVDNRTADELQETWFDQLRLGQIPGAVNVPWDEMVQTGDIPYYEDPDVLRYRFEALGVTPDRSVIVYGLHGVRAAQTYVTLRLLGYPTVRVYDGSWAEWGARDDLPIEPLP